MCPDWESNQQSFGSQAHTHTTGPHQPGLITYFKTNRRNWHVYAHTYFIFPPWREKSPQFLSKDKAPYSWPIVCTCTIPVKREDTFLMFCRRRYLSHTLPFIVPQICWLSFFSFKIAVTDLLCLLLSLLGTIFLQHSGQMSPVISSGKSSLTVVTKVGFCIFLGLP